MALNELDYPKKVAELGKCVCVQFDPTVLSEERKGLDVRKNTEADARDPLSPRGPTMDHVTLGKSFDRFLESSPIKGR